eukprot:PhF_6_TR18876/c1_g1_i1/m.27472
MIGLDERPIVFLQGAKCSRRCRRRELETIQDLGYPQFLYLDQGGAFRHLRPPSSNVLSQPNSTYCFFNDEILHRFKALTNDDIEQYKSSLPSEFLTQLPGIDAITSRLQELKLHFERCSLLKH